MPFERASSPNQEPVHVVGLTGGIASGKSTVAEMFRALGAVILNADQIGHQVTAPGEPALAEIRAAFGSPCLNADGTLNRQAVAQRVFGNPANLAMLNRITHPRIGQCLLHEIRRVSRVAATKSGKPSRDRRVVVVEAALLLEAGWHAWVDSVVVVAVEPRTQLARLTECRGLTPEAAAKRIKAQVPLERRLPYADFIISGESPLPQTQVQVTAVWDALRVHPSPPSSSAPATPASRKARQIAKVGRNGGVRP